MALSHTNVLRETSGNAFGAGAFTTGAFTPGIGHRLIVRAIISTTADSAVAATDMTITDSMGPLTWTPIAGTATADSIGWGYASRAWISSATTGAGSMTITLDCGAFGAENYRINVEALTGEHASPVGATAVGTDADGDGAASITLSGTPAATSIIFALAQGARDIGAGGTVTPGAGWTEEDDTSRADWWSYQTQYITGSTSTSVAWVDLAVGAGAALGAQMIAFEIIAAAGASPPTIFRDPSPTSVADGATATFTVVHDGTSGQWQDDRSGTFANISGETADSYTTAATDQTYQGRKHRFISTNAGGSTTSAPASLGVIGFPVILWSTAVPSGNDVWLRNPEAVSAGGGPWTISVGQVTETDLSQAIGKLKIKVVTQTTETDLAQAFLTKKLKVIGQVTETDLAQAFLKAKLKTIGQTLETDLAQAIARGGIAISVAQVTETDLAQALLHSKLKLIVQSTETDLAQAIIRGGTAIAISAANETDSAQAIGKLKRLLLVASTETDASQAMVRIKVKSLTSAAETDAAIAMARSLKTKGISVAIELDTALAISRLGAAAAAARKLRSFGFGLGIYRG